MLSYVKNQGLSFEVPYRDGAVPRRYLPDFIVRLDDGTPETAQLDPGDEGLSRHRRPAQGRDDDVSWVPGVNALSGQGRWAFFEFREVFAIETTFGELVDKLINRSRAA